MVQRVATKSGQPWLGRRSSQARLRGGEMVIVSMGPGTLVIVTDRAAGILDQYFFVITNPAAGMVGMVQYMNRWPLSEVLQT